MKIIAGKAFKVAIIIFIFEMIGMSPLLLILLTNEQFTQENIYIIFIPFAFILILQFFAFIFMIMLFVHEEKTLRTFIYSVKFTIINIGKLFRFFLFVFIKLLPFVPPVLFLYFWANHMAWLSHFYLESPEAESYFIDVISKSIRIFSDGFNMLPNIEIQLLKMAKVIATYWFLLSGIKFIQLLEDKKDMKNSESV